jgi:tetratricopeptide (TPR) repeat protein
VYLDSDYWYHKGVVLNQMGENEYALNCYNQALKIDPTHRPSRFNLACAYEKLKKYEDASAEFRHAISVKESWPDAHYGLALCSLKLKKYHDAVKNIEDAVKWSRVEYQEKLAKRKQRRIEKERRIIE